MQLQEWNRHLKRSVFLLSGCLGMATLCAADFDLQQNHADGVYESGESVVFTLTAPEGVSEPVDLTYTITLDGHAQQPQQARTPVRIEMAFQGSAWMMVKAQSGDDSKTLGAVVDPMYFPVVEPEPADFDEFWQAQREILNAIPMNPVVTEHVEKVNWNGETLRCFDVTTDCIDGSKMTGHLLMPENVAPGSLPVVVQYQPAGVYDCWMTPQYRNVISFFPSAHGLPIDQGEAFYKEQQGKLNGYPGWGKNDRDQFYFRGMYFRVMRALDYVKTLPEWDGKNLIVIGGSQGGGQSIAAAALDQSVTQCIPWVPALGDHGGSLAGRRPGWPQLYDITAPSESLEATRKCAGYYDNVNFARRIHCRVQISTGFVDMVCPPPSVLTVYTNLAKDADKALFTDPDFGHQSPRSPDFWTLKLK